MGMQHAAPADIGPGATDPPADAVPSAIGTPDADSSAAEAKPPAAATIAVITDPPVKARPARPVTQLDHARAGGITPQMRAVAERERHESSPSSTEGTCTMCGEMCAVRTVNKVFVETTIDLGIR